MRRSRNGPALYELLGGRHAPLARGSRAEPKPKPPPKRHREQPPVEIETGSESTVLGWLSPGRIVKLPVGYLFFGVAGVLIALFGAYLVGFKRMENLVEAQRRAEVEQEFSSTMDPLVSLRLKEQPQPVASGGDGKEGASSHAPVVKPATSPVIPGVVDIGAGEADPRQPGLNYLVAATLPTGEAKRAAEFLAGKGLAVAMVPVHNRPTRREVIVLEGLSREQYRKGSHKLRLEERVRAVGREFDRDYRGGDDFASCWWKKFNG